MLINLNGKFVSEENAKISIFDHGVLYGDGVFEGIRSYAGVVFRLDDHIDRLFNSAKAIMLFPAITKEQMKQQIVLTVRKNNLKDAYIRVVVTRGEGDLGLDVDKCSNSFYFVIADKISLYPSGFYEKGLKVATVATRRNIPEALEPGIKSLNYLNNILAKIEATQMGAAEAVMLNNMGYVSECTGDNLFIVKAGKLITPQSNMGILKGITRDAVIRLAEKRRIEVEEQAFTRFDIYTSDEMFLTGTAAEIIPVVDVDGRIIGDGLPGTITKQLTADFKEITKTDGTPVY